MYKINIGVEKEIIVSGESYNGGIVLSCINVDCGGCSPYNIKSIKNCSKCIFGSHEGINAMNLIDEGRIQEPYKVYKIFIDKKSNTHSYIVGNEDTPVSCYNVDCDSIEKCSRCKINKSVITIKEALKEGIAKEVK